ncbi:MAG: type I glutamate--ammonia ligase [Thermoplasmatota archaeon]
MQDVERAQRLLKDNDIEWVQGHFVDLMGYLRTFSMPAAPYFESAIWKEGMGFDGSSVKGFATVESSDMVIVPDPATLLPLSWLEDGRRARVVMDVFDVASRQHFEGDPRHIARRAAHQVRDMGFDALHLAPEFEFNVFEQERWPRDAAQPDLHPGVLDPVQSGGYFAPLPFDHMEPFRNHLSEALMASGIDVKYHHHEGGTWQHEVEIRPLADAVQAADVTVLFKFMARTLGSLYDLLVSFMPKPVPNEAGSGMHVHLEMFRGGRCAFYDPDEKHHLSQTARYFIGGILEHAPAMTALTNPTVNSYKRLVPHHEAPIHIAWGAYNRSSLVRIPVQAGKNSSLDVEVRHPDPSANPYLAFAAIVHAGLDGIRQKREPGPAVEHNVYAMDDRQLREHGIGMLPRTLGEALEALHSDQVVQDALGPVAVQAFLDLKRREWQDFLTHVSPWDYRRYFTI